MIAIVPTVVVVDLVMPNLAPIHTLRRMRFAEIRHMALTLAALVLFARLAVLVSFAIAIDPVRAVVIAGVVIGVVIDNDWRRLFVVDLPSHRLVMMVFVLFAPTHQSRCGHRRATNSCTSPIHDASNRLCSRPARG